jgi:hypothetical protein
VRQFTSPVFDRRYGKLRSSNDTAHLICLFRYGRVRVFFHKPHIRAGQGLPLSTDQVNSRKGIPSKHGHFVNGRQSPEYRTWAAMLSRTRNPSHSRYPNYGARGIKVCDRWLDFSNFLLDMGLKPSPYHSIERKNNDDGYNPSNCIWATLDLQSYNKRSTIKILVDGCLKTLKECESDYGVRAVTIDRRLRDGWESERAVKTPVLHAK